VICLKWLGGKPNSNMSNYPTSGNSVANLLILFGA